MGKHDVHFDLLVEPWIPVEWGNGEYGTTSIREALTKAHLIRRISGDIPGEPFTLLRLLLAIVYSAYSRLESCGEREKRAVWEELRVRGAFDEGFIESYLAEFPREFDLFDAEHPFYQVPDLAYLGSSKEYDPVSEFMIDVPKPEKYLFSMRGSKHLEKLSFDLAARYLVTAQAYDTAGIKSPVVGNTSAKGGKAYAPKGALGTGWCGALGGIYLEGRNLFETLLLNWVLFLNNVSIIASDDLPPWEREVPSPDTCQREPTGPVDLLTWQSRRMRLIPSEDGASVCGVIISYGDVLLPANKQGFEMMTGWRESKQQQKKLGTATLPLMPVTLDSSRALWRGLSSLLAVVGEQCDLRPGVIRWMDELQSVQSPEDWRLHVRIVCQGVSYGTQSSVIDDAMTDSIDLRATLLRGGSEDVTKLLDVISRTDRAVGALVQFAQNVEKSQGDRRRYEAYSDSAVQAMRDDVREAAYDELDGLYRARIAEFPDGAVEEYCIAWLKETQAILRRLARAYVSRQHVSHFSEHGDVSVGGSFARFERNLAEALF